MIPGVVVLLLVTALGCVPLALVGRAVLRRRRALAAWVPVTARVVGTADPRQAPIDVAMSRGRVATLGVYEYSVDGRTFEGYVPIDGPWREGERRDVDIVVDPADPSRSMEARPVGTGLVVAVAALAVLLVGVGLIAGVVLMLRFAG